MVGIAVLALVLLAACGSDGGTAASPEAPDEAPVTGSAGDATGPGPVGRGAVEGVVRAAGGAAVAGVLIVPVPLDDPAPAVPELAVVTDAGGGYRWDLPGGRYQMRAVRDGTVLGSTDVEVAADVTAPGDIVLR